MQCPSCHFNNLPGQARCGRCQARLVVPSGERFLPGRSTWSDRLRLRLRRRLSPRAPAPSRTVRRTWPGLAWLRRLVNPDPVLPWWQHSPLLAALFSVVPGLGHLYLGQRRRALPFLAAGLVLGVLASRYLWVDWGAWLFSFYCMTAAAALFDASIRPAGLPVIQQFFLSLTVIGLLAMVLSPVAMHLNRLWPTYLVTVSTPVGPFPSGTTLAFDRDAYAHGEPAIGEVVLTRQQMINVVMGLPGEHVEWRDGLLYRNGTPCPGIRPLTQKGNPPRFSAILPADHYLVLPHAVGYDANAGNAFRNIVVPAAIIPRRDVLYRYVGEMPLDWETGKSRLNRALEATDEPD